MWSVLCASPPRSLPNLPIPFLPSSLPYLITTKHTLPYLSRSSTLLYSTLPNVSFPSPPPSTSQSSNARSLLHRNKCKNNNKNNNNDDETWLVLEPSMKTYGYQEIYSRRKLAAACDAMRRLGLGLGWGLGLRGGDFEIL